VWSFQDSAELESGLATAFYKERLRKGVDSNGSFTIKLGKSAGKYKGWVWTQKVRTSGRIADATYKSPDGEQVIRKQVKVA
jgi:hypothetical protein